MSCGVSGWWSSQIGASCAEAAPGGRKGGGQVDVGAVVIASELEVLIDVVQNLMS